MQLSIRLPLLIVTVVITIGIIPAHIQQITIVGSHLRRFTTHVHKVGVFRAKIVMVFGQLRLALRHLLMMTHYTTAATRERTSPAGSALQVQSGTLLRVIATATMGHCTMSATSAAIGRLLLPVSSHGTCTSTAMAVSVRWTAAIGRTASLSVVSKNQNNSISESVCPSVARAYGRAF